MYTFLTPGEKIKKVRKELRITQEELAKNIIDRTYLSKIETNKAYITKDIAEGICSKFNETIIKNKIDKELYEIEYFLEDKETQAKNYINKNIHKLEVLVNTNNSKLKFFEIYNETKDLIEKYYNIYNKKYELYKVTALYLYENFEFEKAEKYTNKCYLIALKKKKYEDVVTAALIQTRIYFRMDDFKEIKRVCENLIYMPECKNINKMKGIYFNLSIAYEKLDLIDKCLNIVNKIRTIYKNELNENNLLDLKQQEVMCYLKNKNYNYCEKKCLEILQESNEYTNTNIIACTYKNLALISYTHKNYKKSKEYIDYALSIKKINSVFKLAEIYEYAFYVYLKLEKIYEAEMYFNLCLKCCEKIKNYKVQVDVIEYAINYYKSINNSKKIIELVELIEQYIIIKNSINNIEIVDILLEVIKYFNNIDINESKIILEKTSNVIKHLRKTK